MNGIERSFLNDLKENGDPEYDKIKVMIESGEVSIKKEGLSFVITSEWGEMKISSFTFLNLN